MSTGTRRVVERPRSPGAPFTVQEAAAELRLSIRTLRRRIDDGEIRYYKDGHLIRIPEAALAEYRARKMGESVPARGTGLSTRRHLGQGKKGAGR